METKKNEIIKKEYVNVYVAVDGTEFNDPNECEAYEKSALGVLKGRMHKIALFEGSECDVFGGCGCDENHAFVVAPKNEDEVKTIQQVAYMKSYGDWKQKHAEKVEVGKVLAVVMGYEDEGAWIIDINAIVRDMTGGKYEVVKKSE